MNLKLEFKKFLKVYDQGGSYCIKCGKYFKQGDDSVADHFLFLHNNRPSSQRMQTMLVFGGGVATMAFLVVVWSVFG